MTNILNRVSEPSFDRNMCLLCAFRKVNIRSIQSNVFFAIFSKNCRIILTLLLLLVLFYVFKIGIYTRISTKVLISTNLCIILPFSYIKREKRQFKVYIDSQVDKAFREFIVRKYGKFEKGLLSLETELALISWIKQHTKDTKINFPKINITPKVQRQFLKLQEYLRQKIPGFVFFPGQKIPRDFLIEAIQNVFGSDPRTVNKYLNLFRNHGYIKPIGPNVYEMLPEKKKKEP